MLRKQFLNSITQRSTSRKLKFLSSYDPSSHSMMGRILCFHEQETHQMSYNIIFEETKEVIAIDPLIEHTPNYLKYMEEKELKFKAIILTSDVEQFYSFYEDLKDIRGAFKDDFEVYHCLR